MFTYFFFRNSYMYVYWNINCARIKKKMHEKINNKFNFDQFQNDDQPYKDLFLRIFQVIWLKLERTSNGIDFSAMFAQMSN